MRELATAFQFSLVVWRKRLSGLCGQALSEKELSANTRHPTLAVDCDQGWNYSPYMLTKMDESPTFFRAGSFMEISPISNFGFQYRIPNARCSKCGCTSKTHHLSYPHLDPREILGKDELRIIDGQKPKPVEDDSIIWSIVSKLRAHWDVPITSGTFFGPFRINVTSKPKIDFDVFPMGFELFVRKPAFDRLNAHGFAFECVAPQAFGKHGDSAQFLQVAVPVVGSCSLAEGESFCAACLRNQGPTARVKPLVLYRSPVIQGLPFFKTIECGYLIFSGQLVEAANQLGLAGLMQGKTIFPVEMVERPPEIY